MNLQNWFMGVVEDDFDPEGVGRVKVRCYGYHNPDRELLPTRDLPYVQTIHPVTAGPAVGGVGTSSTPLLNSIVFGAFYDGNDTQDAVILGVLPGGNLSDSQYDPNTNFGFGTANVASGQGIPFANQPSSSNTSGITVQVGNNERITSRAASAQVLQGESGGSIGSATVFESRGIGIGSDFAKNIEDSLRENPNIAPILVGNNQAGAARNRPIDPKLAAIINTAAARTGLTVSIFSGGQMPEAEYNSKEDARKGSVTEGGIIYQTLDGKRVRTGTTRHDVDAFGNGQAADIWLYKDGRRISLSGGANNSDTILAGKFLEEARALGAQGIGAGSTGYMGGVGAHIDLSSKTTWGMNPAFNSYIAKGDRRNAAGETLPGTLPREIFFGTREVTIGQISQQIIGQGIYKNELEQPIDPKSGGIIQTAENFHRWATTLGVSGITVNSGSNHNVQEGTIFINKSMFGASPENQRGLIVTNPTDFIKWNSVNWGGWISFNLGATGITPVGGLTEEEIPRDEAAELTYYGPFESTIGPSFGGLPGEEIGLPNSGDPSGSIPPDYKLGGDAGGIWPDGLLPQD